MKVVIFLSSLNSGGAERVSATLSNFWVSKGIPVTIITMASEEHDFYPLDPRIERVYLNLLSDSPNSLIALYKNFVRVFALRKILQKVQPDVAISMVTASNIVLALATIGLPIKTIGSERSYPAYSPIGLFWNTLRKYSYRFLSTVTAMTSEGKAWLESNTYAKSVVVIPNSAIWPLPSYEPILPPFQGERRILLSVGRLVEVKGFDMLIDAFSKVAGKHSAWDLVIVGEGHLRKVLEDKIRQKGLSDRVFLPGRAGNVGDWYENADLYVLSSRVEGFPNSLVEAMSYGLPTVSFDCNTGPRDIVAHEINGLLVKPDDVDGLADALGRMMGDDAARQQFSKQAIAVRDKYSLEKISEIWEKLFKEI